eukprot:7983702-Pyramimonas_sp.AAC.1
MSLRQRRLGRALRSGSPGGAAVLLRHSVAVEVVILSAQRVSQVELGDHVLLGVALLAGGGGERTPAAAIGARDGER